MFSFEQEYYEASAFWDPSQATEADQLRVARVLQSLPRDTDSLLDVGCGDGVCCNIAASHLPSLERVVGCDRSVEALKHVSVERKVADIGALPFADGEFDAVVALEILEHLPLPIYRAALNELARVARRQIVVTVPNNERLTRNFVRCPACSTEFNRSLHMRSFSKQSMLTLFESQRFVCQSVQVLKSPRYLGADFLMGVGHSLGYRRNMQHSICPACGYREERFRASEKLNANQLLPWWERSARRVWPQAWSSRWLMGVYARGEAARNTEFLSERKAA